MLLHFRYQLLIRSTSSKITMLGIYYCFGR